MLDIFRTDVMIHVAREKFSLFKTYEEQWKFVVDCYRYAFHSSDLIIKRPKTREESIKYREEGNQLISSNGDVDKVIELYTKSIAYAPPASRELSLAYGNRSAALLKAQYFNECLVDIERALANNYPDELKAKLYARKVQCLSSTNPTASKSSIDKAIDDTRAWLLLMPEEAKGRNLVLNILAGENHKIESNLKMHEERNSTIKPEITDLNEKILNASSAIAIDYSPKYGRHLVATRDIEPGENLAVMKEYVKVLPRELIYRYCANCSINIKNGIPCQYCVNEIYCSEICRQTAWNDYHDLECPIFDALLTLYPEILVASRVFLKALHEAGSLTDLKKMVDKIDAVKDPKLKGFTNGIFDSSKYASVHTLTTNEEKSDLVNRFKNCYLSVTFVFIVATHTTIFGKKYTNFIKNCSNDELMLFVGKLIMKNLFIFETAGMGRMQSGYEILSINPLQSYLNHSCVPGTTVQNEGPLTVIIAIKPFKNGEQIFETYGNQRYTIVPKTERQAQVKKFHHFICDCVACTENWPSVDKLPTYDTLINMILLNYQCIKPQLDKKLDSIVKYEQKDQEMMSSKVGSSHDLEERYDLIANAIGIFYEIEKPPGGGVELFQNRLRFLIDKMNGLSNEGRFQLIAKK